MPIPRLIYGTAWKRSDTARLVALAIRQGFRGIDTACQPKHYDEAGVGEGLAVGLAEGVRREEIYLQSKFTSLSGQDPQRIPYVPHAPLADQVAESFAVTLRNLRSDYLDCLVLHSPLPTGEETLEAWRAIESIFDAGGIRQAGLSNCYSLAELEQLWSSARIKPAVLQNRFYADTGYDRELREFCREHGVVYQSFWTLSANARMLAHPAMASAASAHKRTPAQILFRYLTELGVVPLTGTRSEKHMREDLAILDFELSPAERAAIDQLVAH